MRSALSLLLLYTAMMPVVVPPDVLLDRPGCVPVAEPVDPNDEPWPMDVCVLIWLWLPPTRDPAPCGVDDPPVPPGRVDPFTPNGPVVVVGNCEPGPTMTKSSFVIGSLYFLRRNFSLTR